MTRFDTVEPILTARGVWKHFAGVQALENAELELWPGEVHVLMGSNGSGKSTLCRVIAGAVAPDRGELCLKGKAMEFADPAAARSAGIAVVYQETSLVGTLTVAENILLGGEPTRGGVFIDQQVRRRQVSELIEAFGRSANMRAGIDAFIDDLAIDQRQLVEIMKVIAQQPEVIIFDEATASLDREEVSALFDLIRALRAQGKAIILISHRMEEVFGIGDRITVLRNGKTVASTLLAKTTRDEIIAHMVGASTHHKNGRRARPGNDQVVLRATNLRTTRVDNVSLELHSGEILGLGGLQGQGQSDLLLSLFRAEAKVAGSIELSGSLAKIHSPTDAIRYGFAYISGDRGRAGAFGIRSIFENLVISSLVRRCQHFVRRRSAEVSLRPILETLKVKFASLDQQIQSLSGGNQQKVLVSRWLATKPRILLLDDPTKGIDIPAKEDLYALLSELCSDGASVILYSSEDAELLANADRILVFNSGHVTKELKDEEMTEFNLYSAALAHA